MQPDSESACPKCGGPMEEIESAQNAPKLQQLRLCSKCYLVEWHDENGFQIRQGIPMPRGS